MSIHKAFGCGQPQTEFIFVGQQADYSPYEKRIAYLEGQVRGYERGIGELTEIAKRNKILAEKNGIVADLWMDTLRTLASKGRITKDEANAIKRELEKKLTPEELAVLHAKP